MMRNDLALDGRNARWMAVLLFAGLVLWLCTMPQAVLAQAAGPGRAVLILDGSGSMWGQLAGEHKVVLVRKALKTALGAHAGKIELGLAAFGHRRSVGCNDIAMLLPPQRLDPDIVSSVADKVSPRGSGPIAAALTKIAEEAQLRTRAADLILLADGVDNCRKDPCAAARAIKQTAPRTRIHVLALGAARKPLEPLSCIARASGGLFLTASNGEELATGLGLALKASRLGNRALAALRGAASGRLGGAGEAGTEFSPGLEAEAAGTYTGPLKTTRRRNVQLAPGQGLMSLSAALTSTGKTIPSGLVWRIYRAKAGQPNGYEMLHKKRAPTPRFVLPAGSYMVNAAYGLAHLTQKIEVKAGEEVEAKFILNSGGLRLRGVGPDGRVLGKSQVSFSIYSDDRDQFGKRRLVLANAKPGLVIRLNAGIYHIVSRLGDANATVSADVSVEAGKLSEATVNHSAAQVSFKLVRTAGGEAIPDTQWQLLTADGQLVKRSFGALPTHMLAAGRYRVVARHSGKTYQAQFEIGPGDVTQIEVLTETSRGP